MYVKSFYYEIGQRKVNFQSNKSKEFSNTLYVKVISHI